MAQVFERQAARTPVAIADISVQLYQPEPNTGRQPGASYSVQVRYSNGEINVLEGNLVPYLTQGEIDALLGFMASLRTRAIAEILPTP